MYKFLIILTILFVPFLSLEARGGGRGGAMRGGRPGMEAGRIGGVGRVAPLQRTPAMSRAALYSGAAALGAAAGSNNNGEEPLYVEEPPASSSQSQQ